jgi:hypothetical protein
MLMDWGILVSLIDAAINLARLVVEVMKERKPAGKIGRHSRKP